MTDIALVLDAEVVEPLDKPAAERLDKRIRLLATTINDNIEKLYTLVQDAKAGQIHAQLGFPSWTSYVADVFTISVRIDREQRRELVGYLSGEGMSERAIARITGASKTTVHRVLEERDLEEGGPFGPPEPETEYFADAEEAADCFAMAELSEDEFNSVLADARAKGDLSREHVAHLCRETAVINDLATEEKLCNALQSFDSPPEPTTGLDGKLYPPKPPRPEPKSKPRRGPITDSFDRAVSNLTRATNSIANLRADDRFNRNRSGLSHLASDITRAIKILDELQVQLSCPDDPLLFLGRAAATLYAIAAGMAIVELMGSKDVPWLDNSGEKFDQRHLCQHTAGILDAIDSIRDSLESLTP
jgi:hypothetical protein